MLIWKYMPHYLQGPLGRSLILHKKATYQTGLTNCSVNIGTLKNQAHVKLTFCFLSLSETCVLLLLLCRPLSEYFWNFHRHPSCIYSLVYQFFFTNSPHFFVYASISRRRRLTHCRNVGWTPVLMRKLPALVPFHLRTRLPRQFTLNLPYNTKNLNIKEFKGDVQLEVSNIIKTWQWQKSLVEDAAKAIKIACVNGLCKHIVFPLKGNINWKFIEWHAFWSI